MKLHTRLDKAADELGLWRLPRAEARERLILHYREFAEQLGEMAYRANPRAELGDYVGWAMVGLIESIDKFNPDNEAGASFATFCGIRVRGSALEAPRRQDHFNHKVRAAPGDTLPFINPFPDEGDGVKRGESLVAEPDDDSPLEGAATVLHRLLAAAPAPVATRMREFIDASSDPEVIAGRADAVDVLSRKWKMPAAGVASVLRGCREVLKNVAVAA